MKGIELEARRLAEKTVTAESHLISYITVMKKLSTPLFNDIVKKKEQLVLR